MPGGSYSYRCDACPLLIEVGGGVAWDDDGRVVSELLMVACGACGTMHRLTEQDGTCRVSVFPGPVRGMKTVKRSNGLGDEYDSYEWDVDGEVRDVGELPGGLKALGRLACGHCGVAGRMVTSADLRAPGGGYREAPCPVCGSTLDGFGLSDWI
jgi:hypothetical protein